MKWGIAALILTYVAISIVYVHFRGKVRHRPIRQLSDHSSFMAPINMIMYLFSKLPDRPFHPEESFPELKVLTDNWEIIRDEALTLESHIKGSDKKDDAGRSEERRVGKERRKRRTSSE